MGRGQRQTRRTSLSGPRTRAWPAVPAGQGVDGETGPRRRAERGRGAHPAPAVRRSGSRWRRAPRRSPARALRSRSVLVSAMPRSTTVVPNSDRKPSAAPPQRARACERSCRHARTRSPCPPPSLTMAGRSGRGAMLATSSRARSVGGPARSSRARVRRWHRARRRGSADHQGGELALVASGGADVERVRAVAEGVEVERRAPCRLQCTVRAVGGQHARGRRPDPRLLAGIGGHDPGQQVGGGGHRSAQRPSRISRAWAPS